jgi:replication-associated recombination protein RarA
MSKNFQILTRKNYDFFECSSAFQKSIRRCIEKDALFFGFELAGSGYAEYLWKRMMVIASEDIGLADNNVVVQIQSLYQNWKIIAAKNHAEGSIPITHAILLLARSKKSRVVDNAKMFGLKSDYRPDVPDYALDTHTRRGKRMGRGLQFFIDHGSKLNNVADIEDHHQEFFNQFLRDVDAKKIQDADGYDPANLYHKTTKEKDNFLNQQKQATFYFDET